MLEQLVHREGSICKPVVSQKGMSTTSECSEKKISAKPRAHAAVVAAARASGTRRMQGSDRFRFIGHAASTDAELAIAKRRRQQQWSKQHKALFRKAAVSHLQTGADYCILGWPESNQIVLFSTSGTFGEMVQLFARTLEARSMTNRPHLEYSMADVWERFTSADGGMGYFNDCMARFASLGLNESLVKHITRVYGEKLGRGSIAGDVPASELARKFKACIEGGLRKFCSEQNMPYDENMHEGKEDP